MTAQPSDETKEVRREFVDRVVNKDLPQKDKQ